MIARRIVLALSAVVDVGLHGRGRPVAAKALAARLRLAPRHLEPILQDLVRAMILKGTRGPHGGYELARERRRISAGDVVRAVEPADVASDPRPGRRLEDVIEPVLAAAHRAFLTELDEITIESLCRDAEAQGGLPSEAPGEFDI